MKLIYNETKLSKIKTNIIQNISMFHQTLKYGCINEKNNEFIKNNEYF